MKYLITFITTIIIAFSYANTSNAQIGFAIAQDENRSAIHWQMTTDESSSRANTKARLMLKDNGYNRVTIQPCSDCGHNISSGYWVVVQSDYKIYDGSTKTGFGLGVSTSSISDAERKAVKNLSQYNWSWKTSDKYWTSNSGQF